MGLLQRATGQPLLEERIRRIEGIESILRHEEPERHADVSPTRAWADLLAAREPRVSEDAHDACDPPDRSSNSDVGVGKQI